MRSDVDIIELSVKELLDGSRSYVIPMYQRNYSWEEAEITQLIQDILDNIPDNENKKQYYIGTLVVYQRVEKGQVFETIDGQQRLTTLSLLLSYLQKNGNYGDISWFKENMLAFDSRPKSSKTFTAIHGSNQYHEIIEKLHADDMNTALLNGYRLLQEKVPKKIDESNVDPKAFVDYLLNHVKIMQVAVPEDTDLNHFFEIMNNRGEQLEKHEVLKARLMKAFKDDRPALKCMHLIWDACANMEKYVQMGFWPDLRDAVFGKTDVKSSKDGWDEMVAANFESIKSLMLEFPKKTVQEQQNDENIEELLSDIIEKPAPVVANNTNLDDSPERFNSIINFPNFLLHVLRVQTREDVPLDDKRLIPTFEKYLPNFEKDPSLVKDFIFNLLKCKFLYDKYILKREFIKGGDDWSLKRMKCNISDGSRKAQYVNAFSDEDTNEKENQRILLLLSAFHVSTPTLVYKHWLNGALYYLFHNQTIEATSYLRHLESLAKCFLFDRFLASPGSGLDYYPMIYQNGAQLRVKKISKKTIRERLNFNAIENNLIFNFLDYLLWVKNKTENQRDKRIEDFVFTFRSSVEHYYPQKPKNNFPELESSDLNSFGNLCLISHSKNSTLSNHMPKAKQEYYEKNTIDSIKQYYMMQEKDGWGTAEIENHYKEMENVLLESLSV